LNDVVIRTTALGKKYVIGHVSTQERNTTLREVIGRSAQNALRRTSDMLRGRAIVSGDTTEEFWALKDINFEIKRGEVVGIIGRNGAGKSTLLKVLSQITEPTTGFVDVTGRIGSLLEVGTGFHEDLTGRENTFLNGAILGMSRAEITRKFDEIVAFAEIDRFIDTPVKHYSSGMQMRLAFAVAAHLEPEILIVDEVLAVGDASFQRKCLGKMGDVAGEGRTVLLVSHNMAAIRSLTKKALWLDRGRLVRYDTTPVVTSAYLEATSDASIGYADLTSHELRRSARKALAHDLRFTWVSVTGEDRRAAGRITEAAPMTLDIGFELKRPLGFMELIVRVRTTDGTLVFSCFSGQRDLSLDVGSYAVSCAIERQPLRPGRYVVELVAIGVEIQDMVPAAVAFEVEVSGSEDENPRYLTGDDGLVRVDSSWGAPTPHRGERAGSAAATSLRE
jgi:lipopolysaccharide transport system ATP-binding protein